MAQRQIKNPMLVLCLTLAILCFAAIIVLFIMGGIFYSSERPKVLNYANSMCQVDSRSYRIYQCTSRYYTYICYGPIWYARHGEYRNVSAVVQAENRYRSYIDALNKADEYQIGSSYSCWYDTRNPSVAQWKKPSTVTAIILLCCGGLSVLLFVLFIFLTVKLSKQELLQTRHDNMYAVSYANPYGKQ